MTEAQKRTTEALSRALEVIPEAAGIVLLVVRPRGGDDPSDMDVEIGSAFRARELLHEELQDLLRHAAELKPW